MAEITVADVTVDVKESKFKNGLNKAGNFVKKHKAIVAGVVITALVTGVVWFFGEELAGLGNSEDAPFEPDEA